MNSAGMVALFSAIDHDFGRAKDLVASPIPALEYFENGVVGLG